VKRNTYPCCNYNQCGGGYENYCDKHAGMGGSCKDGLHTCPSTGTAT